MDWFFAAENIATRRRSPDSSNSLMRRFGQIFLEYRRILIPMDSAVRVRSPVCLTDVQKRRRWFERTRRTVALLPSASSGNQAPETALAAAVLGFQPGSIGCVRLEGTEILDCGCEALALYEMPRRQRVGLAAFEDRMDDIGRQVGKPQNPADTTWRTCGCGNDFGWCCAHGIQARRRRGCSISLAGRIRTLAAAKKIIVQGGHWVNGPASLPGKARPDGVKRAHLVQCGKMLVSQSFGYTDTQPDLERASETVVGAVVRFATNHSAAATASSR
jgi:hypothetical protein